jgi:C-terminal processing protease CtpA/Prc
MMENTLSAARLVAALALLAPLGVAAQPPDVAQPAEAAPDRPAPVAEPRAADEPDRAVEPEAAPQQRSVEQGQSQLRRELEQAQSSLEEAAREIARLSAELAAPVVDEVARRFRTTGPRVMLGLNIEDADSGVRVVGVSPNGPAATAGLQTGDVVVALDGERLDAAGDTSPSRALLAHMRSVEPGDDVLVTVRRADSEVDLRVATRELGPPGLEPPGFNLRLRQPPGAVRPFLTRSRGAAFGGWRTMELVPLTPVLGAYFGTDDGLLVVRAPADDALGLRDGDVILDISGREPTTPEHAMRILASFEPGETLRMTIMREQRRETLELALPEG